MAVQRNDILWKGIIEDLFEDLLRFFFKEADSLFDFARGFSFLEKELAELFPAQDLKHPKSVDKLVRVFTKSDAEQWLLVHLEVQGYPQQDFARRMFTYYYRILDKFKKPVTCIVIFLGKRSKQHASLFEQEFLGSKIRFEYNSYYIGEQDEVELKKMDNPFAIVVRTALMKWKHHRNTARLLKFKISLARELLQFGLSKEKTRRLFSFLNYYIHFEDRGLNTKFDRQLELLTNKTTTKMGITEQLLDIAEKRGEGRGLQKGLQKGKTEGLREGEQKKALSIAKQLKTFGVSIEIIRKSTGLGVRRIKAL